MDTSTSDSPQGTWWKRHGWTAVALVCIILLAGALRIAFNYGPAINHGEYRYAGNDDYYHFRVVQNVQTTGNHVLLDPLLNYPAPFKNPRPPLFDWHMAIMGQIFGFLSGEATPGHAALHSGAYAVEWGSALTGTLTVIPIWLIGRATFGNRAGLWAAFLLAASPAHIQRGGFGLGDHDAFIIFFLCLGYYFLIRALQLTRDDVRVEKWSNLNSVGNGFSSYAATHVEGLAYAFLAGVSLAAIGLAWEGWPYALAIYAIYYTFQLISNQMRRRDSTGDFLVFGIVIGTVLALVIPYYWITGNIGTTLNSATYVILILGVLSLVLIPTRDLPAILVLPGLVLIGLLGMALLFFVAPDIGAQLISANGYFNQSKLYSTIAEAQRTELGVFVFSIGFMTFFFGLVAFVMATLRYFRTKDRAMLFLVAWALLSIYMGFAATRFVFNAAPVFCILAGWITVRIINWMNFKERMKNFQSLRQESFFKATRSTLGAKQIAGSLFLLLFLIIPNLWFSIDAGIPSEFRADYRNNHPGSRELIDNLTGAFGQGFLDPNWLVVYGWLNTQDKNVSDAQKPAHIAWWDYGFWEVAIGHHPTVSDNFQNGHQLAGRFLAAQGEKEGIDWLIIRLLEGDWAQHQKHFSPEVRSFLANTNASWPDRLEPIANQNHYDEALAALQSNLQTLQQSVDFYQGLQDVTHTSISYFITDNRMLPYDDPNTPGTIESGSILYAPIYLADKNPDDFVQTVYTDTQGNEYNVVAYTKDAAGHSQQQRPVRIEDQSGTCYFVSGGLLYRAAKNCKQIDYGFNNGQGVQLQGTKLKFKDAYYATMFYKGFVGGDKPPGAGQQGFPAYPNEAFQGNGTAGKGLLHFRQVNATHSVKLLEYYAGAVVTGKATLADGTPLAGYTVTAQDPFGISHDATTAGADGSFRLLAPFSLPGEHGVRITVQQGGADVQSQDVFITREAALHHADYNFTVDVKVQPGTVNGFVYEDRNHDGQYNASLDKPLGGVAIAADGRNVTSNDQGQFTLNDALPGQKSLTGTLKGYDTGSGSVFLAPGGTANAAIAMTLSKIPVSGTLTNTTDGPLPNINVQFTAKNPTTEYTQDGSAVSGPDGNFTTSLAPGGTYKVTVNDTVVENNKTYRYKGEMTLSVPVGSDPITITKAQLALTRTEEP